MYTGFNGTNWFEASTAYTDRLIVGAAPEKGFTLRFRGDKPETYEILINEVNALIALKEKFDFAYKELNVIFTASLDTFSYGQTIMAINLLIAGGVKIIAVQAGNEYYSKEQANFEFEIYKAKFEPLRNLIRQVDPYIPFVIFMAPRPKEIAENGTRNAHSIWNNQVIEYLKTQPQNDGVSIHLYPDAREIPIVEKNPTKQVVSSDMFSEDLNNYYYLLAEQSFTISYIDSVLSYLDTYLPERKVYVTEFGIGSPGNLKNTIGYSQAIYNIWIKYVDKFYCLLEHNGVSLSLAGSMSPATKKDDTDVLYILPGDVLTTVPRLSFFTYKLFNSLMDNSNLSKLDNIDNLSSVGSNAFYYVNTEKVEMIYTITVPQTYNVNDTYLESIIGSSQYASSGTTPFMSGGTTPTYEITNSTYLIPTVTNTTDGSHVITAFVPANSFGYLYLETAEIVVENPRKKKWWCKFLERFLNIPCNE